jgi:hypothetical protein
MVVALAALLGPRESEKTMNTSAPPTRGIRLYIHRLLHIAESPTREEERWKWLHKGEEIERQRTGGLPPVWPKLFTIAPPVLATPKVLHWPTGQWRETYFMAHPEKYKPRYPEQQVTPVADIPTLHGLPEVAPDASWLNSAPVRSGLLELEDLATAEIEDDDDAPTAYGRAIMLRKVEERAHKESED